MKRNLLMAAFAVLGFGVLFNISGVLADDQCSMTTSSGKVVNLGILCGKTGDTPPVSNPTKVTNPSQSKTQNTSQSATTGRMPMDIDLIKTMTTTFSIAGSIQNNTGRLLEKLTVSYQLSKNNGEIKSGSFVITNPSTIKPGQQLSFSYPISERNLQKAAISSVKGTPALLVPIRSPIKGSCDCPYDIDATGRTCGDVSAYIRKAGKVPICYQNN